MDANSDTCIASRHSVSPLTCLIAVLIASAGPSVAQDHPQPRPEAATTSSIQWSEAEGYWREPALLSRGIDIAVSTVANDPTGVKNGVYPDVSLMPTGAGWLAGGPGFRYWMFGETALAQGAVAYSWRGYKAVQGRIELPSLLRSRLGVGTQYRWRDLTQVVYFGQGSETRRAAHSEYRFRAADVTAFAVIRPRRTASITARVGWLHRPELSDPTGHFFQGDPSVFTTFASDPAVTRGRQPNFATTGVSAAFDRVRHPGHPISGQLIRAGVTHFRDLEGGRYTFRRWDAEAEQFVPMADERIVFACRAWLIGVDSTTGSLVPFYALPGVGGQNTLRSYEDFRFHDRRALVVNGEARVAIFTHLDGSIFVDAGSVGRRTRDLDLRRVSLGAGLRLHTARMLLLRLDVAHGSEGWRAVLKTSEPLRIRRESPLVGLLPFVP